MILVWIIGILVVAGPLAWLARQLGPEWPRWVSLTTLTLNLVVLLAVWAQASPALAGGGPSPWLVEYQAPWIPQLGISFHLAMDGLSLPLVILTQLLGIMGVATSWHEVTRRVGFFHFHLLWTLAGLTGAFLAIDMFLFYLFWEAMLVPLYFLIGLWGHEQRRYAAIKFFIFTQAGGLLMLLAILGLAFMHSQATGVLTFDYMDLLGTAMPSSIAFWLMLGFFLAFAVKLPAVPLHTWLPDAHTQAPTAGSVDLAGLVLKIAAYGMMRFMVPLFPGEALAFAPVAMALAVASILYGAMLAYSQTDLKRLVAYTSVSHMGFVLLGIFSWNEQALQGAVVIMIAHGLSTGALFALVGDIQERIHTREMGRMGGMWATMPRMGAAGLFFALASLGLPGLANFVGEFLVLLGAFQANAPMAVLASLGFIMSTVYALWMIQRVFYGPNLGPDREGWRLPDTTWREGFILWTMALLVLCLGIYPQPMLRTAKHGVDNVIRQAGGQAAGPAATIIPAAETSIQPLVHPSPYRTSQ